MPDPAATEAAVADFAAEPEPGRRIRSLGAKANALAKSNPEAVVGIYSRAINHDLAMEAEENADLTPAGNLEIRISADSWNHIKHSLAQLARIAPAVAAAVIDKTDDEFRAALSESTTAELLPDPYTLALYMRAMQDSDLAKGIGWQVAESLLDSQGESEARRLLPAYEEILHVPSQDMIDRILARRFSETKQAANP